jgi:RNA polymerase sigma-70 factor (ECF subfamily)
LPFRHRPDLTDRARDAADVVRERRRRPHRCSPALPCRGFARSPVRMNAADFAAELDSHRGYLLRVAQLQLRDADLAEDVVQETLLAALAGGGFSGKSSLKTWLTGILKHKIVDAIRRKQRAPVAVAQFADGESDIDEFDALFKESGAWESPPADWGDPEASLGRRQFFEVMDLCLEKLPPNTARVFVMREVLELETDEICKELSITANNLWVILYRARMALRVCLEQNWFAGAARG